MAPTCADARLGTTDGDPVRTADTGRPVRAGYLRRERGRNPARRGSGGSSLAALLRSRFLPVPYRGAVAGALTPIGFSPGRGEAARRASASAPAPEGEAGEEGRGSGQ